jgi:hypothetical protein
LAPVVRSTTGRRRRLNQSAWSSKQSVNADSRCLPRPSPSLSSYRRFLDSLQAMTSGLSLGGPLRDTPGDGPAGQRRLAPVLDVEAVMAG